MIAILFALESEAKSLLEKVSNKTTIEFLDKKAYSCSINSQKAVIVITGIGKVSASICAQAVIDKFSPKFIINAGTCGGTNTSVKIGSYYLVDKCFQFDFDVTEIDDVEIGYIQEYDRVFFPTYLDSLDHLPTTSLATADRFSNEKKDLDLLEKNKCAIRDMEGGAIAQTCLSNKTNFVCIKGVTDVYGSGVAKEQFYKNLSSVCAGLSNVIIETCKKL